jgi:hypothetical protein
MGRETPSFKRESTIARLISLLGNTETKAQRFNVGYAHHSLPRPSAFIRAFEKRWNEKISNNNGTIIEVVPIPGKQTKLETKEVHEKFVGKTIIAEGPLFSDTMTLTKWLEGFYQESPSINARARDDLMKVGEKAFTTTPIQGWQGGGKDPVPEAD